MPRRHGETAGPVARPHRSTVEHEMSTPDRWLKLLLRLGGGVMLPALPASLLPVSWMAAAHAWLGLGQFPDGPIVIYLARSIALLYAMLGGLKIVTATNPPQFRAIIRYLAIVEMCFGAAMLPIDLLAGMPWHWTALEGPPVIALSAVIYLLNEKAARAA
jgi:hypothetical protein